MSFGMIMLNQITNTMQKYATWIQIAFIIHIKTEDVYEDIADDVEKRFQTSNYEINRPSSIGKNKVIGLMKDELGRKIMTKFLILRPNTFFYLIDYSSSDNKAKGIKKCVIKQRLKFIDYENSLQNNETI